MLTKDFINTSLPLLTQNDKVKKALDLMHKFHLEHLAACINGNYGFLSYDTLHIIPEDTPLSKVEQLLQKASVSTKDHIWDSLSSLNQYETEALPMLNQEQAFYGTVVGRDLFKRIREIFPIGTGGAILELEMSYQSYSIQELGGIVEGTNTKITQLSIFPIEGTSKVNVVICIDKNDATDVIHALERHSYHVNAWFMHKGRIDNILEDRYDAFMKYINV